jgi:hypothetical protein
MERTLNPVLRAVLDTIEPELGALGFRLASEAYRHSAFGSAELEYERRGARLRFTWDGKDHWAWMNLAAQPTAAFPNPSRYSNVDAAFTSADAVAPWLSTPEQGVMRGRELVERVRIALAGIPNQLYNGCCS